MDYDAIRADDPGGTVQEAHATLAAMTITETYERMVTERGLYNELGPTEAEDILTAITGSAVVPTRAKAWLAPDAGGIDVGSAVARSMLDAMETAGELTAQQVEALKALGEREVAKYPGLKQVHIQIAREGA